MTKILPRLLILMLTISMSLQIFAGSFGAQDPADDGTSLTYLRNSDILRMVKQKITPEKIIDKIKSSHCSFDTFPPMLRELKLKGVPESILQVMADSPNGPPNTDPPNENYEQPIYHYAEELKQAGALNISYGQRRGASYRQSGRTRASILRRGQ